MADRYTIAAELKAYISAHARTQKEAADKCKISPPHFANLLNGKEAIGYSASRRIAGAFPEIDPDYLLTGEGVLCPPPGTVRITAGYVTLQQRKVDDVARRVYDYVAGSWEPEK